jgi:hypothetical protein
LRRVATPLAAQEEAKEEEDPFAVDPFAVAAARQGGGGAPAAEEVDPFVVVKLAAPLKVLDVGVGSSSSAAAGFGFSDPFAVDIAPARHAVAGGDADDFGFGLSFGGGFPAAGLADFADFADPFAAFAPAPAGAGFDPFGASSEDTRPHQSEALMPNPHTPATPPRTPPLRSGRREEEDEEVWPTYLTYADVC